MNNNEDTEEVNNDIKVIDESIYIMSQMVI